ncbi:MAG TPA: hypothetical protein VLA82_13500 [Actinomycetota bacterium]|nr:hypothetical protein [Actinomycetota bacterium]
MRDECGTCGAGHRLVEATFDLDGGQVHWTMWSCGHAARAVIDTHDGGLVPATN